MEGFQLGFLGMLVSMEESSGFLFLLSLTLSSGGSGGHLAWGGEGSDIQGVLAVGVCGQSSDAAGSPVGSP